MSRRWLRALLPALLSLFCLSLALPAHAQSTIKRPGDRPDYVFELEPHLALGLFDPPGYGGGTGFGFGVRGSVQILKNGFIPKLNNSVAIGFGLDYLRYAGGADGDIDYFYAPVVMQWNFWLHKRWSVFGEPGVALYVQDGDFKFDPFVFYAGGRFHLTDRVTLTARLGYPTFSFGVSFLF